MPTFFYFMDKNGGTLSVGRRLSDRFFLSISCVTYVIVGPRLTRQKREAMWAFRTGDITTGGSLLEAAIVFVTIFIILLRVVENP